MPDEIIHRLAEQNGRPYPENAGTELCSGTVVFEESPRFQRTSFDYEIFAHDKHDVNIVGLWLTRHIAAENHKPLQHPGCTSQLINATQSPGNLLANRASISEPRHDFFERCWVNARRQVAFRI